MRRQTRYEVGLHLRLSAEDFRRLEAIAERERSNISVVARRLIAEGLERLEAEPHGPSLSEARRKTKAHKDRGRKP